MIDYSQWERKSIAVTNLLLDPENPRIPPTIYAMPQDELLAELIEHDRVYELAKKIVANGYYADELLITAPRDGKLIVVEGNRRLAALKSILSPEAVPEAYRKKFRELSAKIHRSMIKSIPVVVAPSRDIALPRIAEKHTRSLLEQWKPAQQALFYRSLIEQGKSEEDICGEYGLTDGELGDFLRMDTLYKMACSLDFPEDVQKKVENPRKFHITNLERFMESRKGRDFLSVEPDGRYGFQGNIPASEFKIGFRKVVSDVARNKVTSRDLNNEKTIPIYLDKIEEYRPDKSKNGSFKSSDIIKKLVKKTDAPKVVKKKARSKRSSSKIIPASLKCRVDNRRVEDVFKELKKLKVADVPNAVAIMLRVLLELSVSHHIQKVGKTEELLKKSDPKSEKPREWHPSLRQQLNFLIEDSDLPLEPLDLRAIRRFTQDKTSPMTLDSLDGYVHNKQIQPTEPELRAIWERIEPLFQIVLSEPEHGEN